MADVLSRETKDSWVDQIIFGVTPLLEQLGFSRKSDWRFIRKSLAGEDRFLLLARYPRHRDDVHLVYVNPCIHVVVSEIEEIASHLSGVPRRKNFPTIGGSVGLFTADMSIKEWPMDSIRDVAPLIAQFEEDIRAVGVKFWRTFGTVERIAQAIEQETSWARFPDSWRYRHLAVLFLSSGKDEALRFLETNAKKFVDPSPEIIKRRLQRL